MIPYFQVPAIPLGPVDLQPFGILVAAGVLIGANIVRRRGDDLKLDDEEIRLMLLYCLVGGFAGAHIFDVLFYQMDDLKKDPLLLIKIWAGISSYGGFLGGLLGGFLFLGVVKPIGKYAYADAAIWGLLPGFTFGRMGCTIVRDHPGRESDFAMAFEWGTNVVQAVRLEALQGKTTGLYIGRHNLGFYELLYLLALVLVVLVLTRVKKPVGFIAAFVPIAYAPVRFFLEYLRLEDNDPRYLGLTFAQYVSLGAFLFGAFLMYRIYKNPCDVEADAALRQARRAENLGGKAPAAAKPVARDAKKKRKKT